MRGYRIVRRDRVNNKNASGGVAILVNEDINMEVIDMTSYEGINMEVAGIRIELNNGKKTKYCRSIQKARIYRSKVDMENVNGI